MAPNPETNESPTDVESTSDADAAAAAEGSTDESSAATEEPGVEVQTPEFQSFAGQDESTSQNEISRFHDIKVTVSAELGRTSVPIQKLLSLGTGSILELNRSIDSPIELIAQGVPLASGEVVVVDDCFAIRITEVYPKRQAG